MTMPAAPVLATRVKLLEFETLIDWVPSEAELTAMQRRLYMHRSPSQAFRRTKLLTARATLYTDGSIDLEIMKTAEQ